MLFCTLLLPCQPAGKVSRSYLSSIWARWTGGAGRKKIHRYLPFLSGQLQQAFGTDVATVAVIVPGIAYIPDAAHRAAELKRWTEQELTQNHTQDIADIFY